MKQTAVELQQANQQILADAEAVNADKDPAQDEEKPPAPPSKGDVSDPHFVIPVPKVEIPAVQNKPKVVERPTTPTPKATTPAATPAAAQEMLEKVAERLVPQEEEKDAALPNAEYDILSQLLWEFVQNKSLLGRKISKHSPPERVEILAQGKYGGKSYKLRFSKRGCVAAVYHFGVAFGCIEEGDPRFGPVVTRSKCAASEGLLGVLCDAKFSHNKLIANEVDDKGISCLKKLEKKLKKEAFGLQLPVFRFFAHYMHIKREESVVSEAELNKQLRALTALVALLKPHHRRFGVTDASCNVLDLVRTFLAKRYDHTELRRYAN